MCRRSKEWDTHLKELSQEYKKKLKLRRIPSLCDVERIELLRLKGITPIVSVRRGKMVIV